MYPERRTEFCPGKPFNLRQVAPQQGFELIRIVDACRMAYCDIDRTEVSRVPDKAFCELSNAMLTAERKAAGDHTTLGCCADERRHMEKVRYGPDPRRNAPATDGISNIAEHAIGAGLGNQRLDGRDRVFNRHARMCALGSKHDELAEATASALQRSVC